MNQARLAQVRAYMSRDGLEQILVTSTASVYYLTGIWVEPMERMLALYIPQEGPCVLYGNAMFGLPSSGDLEIMLHSDGDEPVAQLSGRLNPGILGVDKSWPSKFLIRLLQSRPDIVPTLGSAPVDDARKQKDAEEIAAMQAASRINDQVMEAAIAAIGEGVTENQLAALIEQEFRVRGAGHSSEGQLVCFGPNGADPHHAPGETVIRPGDSVVMDIFIPIRRYWCDMTRTVFFRQVDEEQRRVYETVRAANLAAEAVVRPGIPMCEIDAAARRIIEEAGYGPYFTHRLGHGCGLECHEPPDNSSNSQAVAQPGMVFSIEPGIYLPGKLGVRIEDLVLVTQTGCQVLNNATKDLLVVG